MVVAPTAPTKPIVPTAPTMSPATSGSLSEVNSSSSPASTTASSRNHASSATQVTEKSSVAKTAADQVDKTSGTFSSSVLDPKEEIASQTVIPSNQLKPIMRNSTSEYTSFLIVVVAIVVILIGWLILKIITKKANIKAACRKTAVRNNESESAGSVIKSEQITAHKGNNFDFRV
ncbi:MAG: hypothetical protein H6Q73_2839 [Firmicutes bacterium]|nr:hypothetical protein [Bacillota bacterium]